MSAPTALGHIAPTTGSYKLPVCVNMPEPPVRDPASLNMLSQLIAAARNAAQLPTAYMLCIPWQPTVQSQLKSQLIEYSYQQEADVASIKS